MSKWWKPGPFPYPLPADKNYEVILPSCLLHESSEWILFLSSVVTFHTSKVHLAHKSLHIRFPPRLFSPIQQNWFSVDQINQVYLHVRRLEAHQKLKSHQKSVFYGIYTFVTECSETFVHTFGTTFRPGDYNVLNIIIFLNCGVLFVVILYYMSHISCAIYFVWTIWSGPIGKTLVIYQTSG